MFYLRDASVKLNDGGKAALFRVYVANRHGKSKGGFKVGGLVDFLLTYGKATTRPTHYKTILKAVISRQWRF